MPKGLYADMLVRDLLYVGRTLRARPVPTLTAVLTLALGIGGSTAIFSLARAVLLGDLPFRDPERLVMVWDDASAIGFPRNDLTPATYEALRTQNQAFEDLAAVAETGFTLTGGGEPLKVEGRRVTASFFATLGVAPALGRGFRPDEDEPGSGRVAVLSHGLWQRRFGGDPDILGRDILLNGEKHTVIGVMPRGFQFMEGYVGLWVPAAFSAEELANRSAHYVDVVARMKAGVTVARAQAEVETIARRYVREFPDQAFRAFVLPLREQLVGQARRPFLVLGLAIVVVLVITCANLAGLLLGRAASRGREIAVRTALGATRARVVRLFLTESIVLGVLGGIPGALVAAWALDALQGLVPESLALFVHPNLDARAGVAILGLSILTGLLIGLVPALQAARGGISVALRQGGRGSTGAGHRRLRSALVVAQFAASLVLLVGAGLLGQTLYRLRYADLGLRPDKLLTLRTPLPPEKYAEPARRAAFYEDVLERVEALPGVVSAGYSTSVPLEWKGGTSGFTPEGPVDPRASYDAVHRQVSVDYLKTMGIPLRRGRHFERADGAGGRLVAIVNETLARQYWPGVDALGKRFKVGKHPDEQAWITIVGIVGDVRQMGLDAPVKAEMYFPYSQMTEQPWFAPRDLVIRAAVEPMSLVSMVKDVVRAVDPEQAVANIRTYNEILDEEVASRRLGAALVSAFAALALLLASLGVYGVLSHFVIQHTAEIGVRLALGATRGHILGVVLGRGMALALLGLGLGFLGALAFTRVLSNLLYGVAAIDPASFGGAALVLAVVALLACYLPARRALAIDPTAAMRCE